MIALALALATQTKEAIDAWRSFRLCIVCDEVTTIRNKLVGYFLHQQDAECDIVADQVYLETQKRELIFEAWERWTGTSHCVELVWTWCDGRKGTTDVMEFRPKYTITYEYPNNQRS